MVYSKAAMERAMKLQEVILRAIRKQVHWFEADNTISYGNRVLQIERTRWRGTLAGCRVLVCEHLDGALSVYCGLWWDDSRPAASGTVEKTLRLEILQTTRDFLSHRSSSNKEPVSGHTLC